MIAKIAVSAANFAIDKPYSYFLPAGMELTPGQRVAVPFGRGNRPAEGIVLQVSEGDPQGLKPVTQCLDRERMLSDTMLHLAAFLRERYFCTFYEAARCMLPAGLWFRTQQRFSLTEDRSWQEKTPRQREGRAILQLLSDLGGEASQQQLAALGLSEEEEDRGISYLLKKKWITAQTDYRRRTADKTEKIATLAVSSEEAMAFASGRPKKAVMQKNVLQLLCGVGSAGVKDICYYTGAKPGVVSRLAELGYVSLSQRPVLRCRQWETSEPASPMMLNPAQQACFDGLREQMERAEPGVALLHGVTGSGKTAVYLRLIASCLEKGKSAVLLVPEIALTPQLLHLLAAHFSGQVAVLHSSLPAAERYDQWKRVRSGDARVVVGTRSGVFAPCERLGLLILDEEQEHSYKSENSPRYAAKEVAIWRGARENALVLLGSATPSVETMYQAKNGIYQLYRLPERYNGRPLPQVQVVDMRKELEDGNDRVFSVALGRAMEETAGAGKQTVLLLNRRGNSRALVCVDCREAPECPRCSARLTYHSANGRLMCHYCGHSQPVPAVCPTCGGPLKQVGVGTQKVQEQLQEAYPGLTVARMDADTVSAANTHENILDRFQQSGTDVLLGTQMVAKGLNLPNVTLVGVLDGDLGLYQESFRAAENTFHMLTQVVGRAGRGTDAGRAVIQTLVPEHTVIQLAAKQDYEGFYQTEIQLRRQLAYPPFGDIGTITVTGQEEARVLRGAAVLRDSLQRWLSLPEYRAEQCAVLGPAPCPVPKINYHFRYRLMLRCRMTRSLRLLLADLLRQFLGDTTNRGISAFVDVNGFD